MGKGAIYLYIETLLSLISGYAFWVILSRIVAPDVIGVSSAVISLATIFATIATIGIPTGIQRFLGKSFSDQKLDDARAYVIGSLIWISIGIAGSSLSLVFLHNWLGGTFEIDFDLMLVAILLVFSSVITTLFRAIIISSLKTKILPLTMAASTFVKLTLAIILALTGFGALGIMISFTSFSVIASIILAFVLVNIFRQHTGASISLSQSSRNILTSSAASWIPAVIYTVGAHLGPVIVFGSQGAGEAGVYFMAFAIVIAISAVMQVLFTIAYPTLSGMKDGRKRLTWQTIKMSILIALPLSSALIFYSSDIMLLFGSEYAVGGESLSVLLLSMLPIAITTGISILAYAYGNYRHVLAIGIASNLPRVILYLTLLPLFGSSGAAISYTVGSIMGLAVSVVIARKIGIILIWKDITLITIVPSSIAFLLSYAGANYIIGTVLTIIISYLLFIRFNLLTKTDFQNISEFLPSKISTTILVILNSLDRLRKS